MTRRVLTLAMLLAMAALAHAGEPRVAAGLVVQVPDGWTVSEDGKLVSLVHPQGEVSLQLIQLSERDLARAQKRVFKDLPKSFQDIQWDGAARKLSLNGMAAWSREASARLGKQAVRLGVLAVRTPKRRVVLVMAVSDAARAAANTAVVAELVGGLKPAK